MLIKIYDKACDKIETRLCYCVRLRILFYDILVCVCACPVLRSFVGDKIIREWHTYCVAIKI